MICPRAKKSKNIRQLFLSRVFKLEEHCYKVIMSKTQVNNGSNCPTIANDRFWVTQECENRLEREPGYSEMRKRKIGQDQELP